jgi:hypothetical protein
LNSVFLSDFEQIMLDPNGHQHEGVPYDLAIVSFGKTTRNGHLLNLLGKGSARFVIAVSDAIETEDKKAVSRFESFFSASVCNSAVTCERLLSSVAQSAASGAKELKVLIDVSCLTRIQMGNLFASIKTAATTIPIHLAIGYCLARYARPPDQHAPLNRRIAPVHRAFSGWTAMPTLPVDVVVSVGYEKGKALGAVEYLEPRGRWVFVPNSPESRFLREVMAHNRELIHASSRTVINYEVLKPVDTYYRLLSLVSGLATESRPVLLPFGPKLFFAVSLLVAMSLQEAAVWYVDGEDELSGALHQASNYSVLMTCHVKSRSD